MTSSQKLDRILAEGYEPDIRAVVDCDVYKYVWGSHENIICGNYTIIMVYGLLSDGATGVPDRVFDAFFGHDRLYLDPRTWYKNVAKNLRKRQCDKIYARLGWQGGSFAVWLEGMAMLTNFNWMIWRNYRKQDSAKLIEEHMVPKALCWEFPTEWIGDAVWVG